MAASKHFPTLPPGWREEEIHFNRRSLFMRVWWNPAGSTGRALYLVHGFGEQSDRYLHLPHFLRTSVDVIAAIDLPGHGKSAGQRGHCESFDEMTDAALEGFEFFRGWLAGEGMQKKISWLAHSMGGLTTLLALQDHPDLPLQSVILSAPLLALSMPVPKIKEFVGNLIEPIFPRLSMDSEVEGSILSRDPEVALEYRANPLNHSKVTPRMFKQMTLAMARAVAMPGPLPYSTMLILPLADRLVDSPTTFKKWLELKVAEGRRKELTTWPEATHESMNDLDRARVFNAIEAWLEKVS